MRTLGILVLLVGVVMLISALAMDTTVGTMSGDRVNNIGLIAAREQRTIIAGIALTYRRAACSAWKKEGAYADACSCL
ncbi:hypothetical protein ACM7I5_11065 [Pseudomonas aeruginosa]|uniref:Uncharacterized protein n=1 Tax=Pseudomonas phage YMC11/02/R656 TaxID=1755689 RepID=A0A0S2SYL0_9CAUD|nr:hypothetical protein [Pseudomonas aeruginosa]YP_009187450.1 hypothetical protein AU162_gp053 [Pseudomonas phage YMC11/02/R656]ALP47874.1 hypothetical protein BPPAER656_00530 [Pseudomonas phage YMC11/02/R656]MBA4932521.1 hypothetical protein [Pseudomonas aeruginosa]MCS8417467.1 hypothetical protein [Pseudomonas aeruginosa]MCS9169322.1 hypothetical protein [Pseudomonas aeruginosa]MCS9489129.1 hypothetical protein [Pseudomonas aeruginosa]